MSFKMKNKGSTLIIVTIVSSLLSLVLFSSLALVSSFNKSTKQRIDFFKEKLSAESNCISFVNKVIKGEDISSYSNNIIEKESYYYVFANSDKNIFRCDIDLSKSDFSIMSKEIYRL